MNPKQLAGEKAVDFIEEGMVLGLGTGSTVYFTALKLAEKIKAGFNITVVSTSNQTTELARKIGIELTEIDDVAGIDLTIDGADEVDSYFNGIKGGGGALLREKIVAFNSRKNIWVVDSSKVVANLGKFPLPIEVVSFGSKHVMRKLTEMGCNPELRYNLNKPFITDHGNFIVDLHMHRISDAYGLHRDICEIPGVVETGLFLGVVDMVIEGAANGVNILKSN